ncbi:alpha/beta hydrolase [Tenacibaculum ovolyticum]|uniref:alpha/beta hydrolase n=1 Tax=Tenacibaculum ovolyticum TaxID=104270 RepID=UPI001F194000|nr:alpha/beta hydrolase [Tenacibaculum ovolyticum]
MKPRLLILSDLWGGENIEWLSLYIKKLSVKYEVKFYDSCLLAGIANVNLSEEERHLHFVDKGINEAVTNLLELEKTAVTILAFSIGGVIGWKAALKGLKVTRFIAVSSTRLRYEVAQPFCDIMLYYGELDDFKPEKVWFDSFKELDYQLILNKNHTMYKEVAIINKVCLELVN